MPAGVKKKRKTFKETYPILYTIGGIPIRKVNHVSIYISENNMASIARAVTTSGMSVAKILAYSGQPCECCKEEPVQVVHKKQLLLIPRGLLSAKKQSSGGNIEKKNRS